MDHICIQSIINKRQKKKNNKEERKGFKLINKQIRLTKLEKHVS